AVPWRPRHRPHHRRRRSARLDGRAARQAGPARPRSRRSRRGPGRRADLRAPPLEHRQSARPPGPPRGHGVPAPPVVGPALPEPQDESMQVKIEDVSPVEKKLIVSVPWTAVDSRMGEAFRELAKSVHLKGFRKGKVPRSVLEKMFGKRVRAEVADQLIRESFVTAVTEHNLQAVSEPRMDQAPSIES